MEKISFTSAEQVVAAVTLGEAVILDFHLQRPMTPKAGGGYTVIANGLRSPLGH